MAGQSQGSGPSDTKWLLTPEEFSHHFAYYHRITPRGEYLGGARAREFFLQSRLPPQILSQIWKLSDVDGDGRLNAAEFSVAMHLVQQALGGVALPSSLPPTLHTCIKQALNPQLPVADNNHLLKCRSAFSTFHENIGKGVLGGEAARYLFMKSNLSKGQLFHIWKLSDLDKDGHLTFQEFTVAMHLIFISKLGYILPVHLDPTTILPPSFDSTMKQVQAEAEKLPETEPVRVTIDPFSPPATPTDRPPSEQKGNPFVGDTFVTVATDKFREGNYEDFLGDPFQTMDPFAENGPQNGIREEDVDAFGEEEESESEEEEEESESQSGEEEESQGAPLQTPREGESKSQSEEEEEPQGDPLQTSPRPLVKSGSFHEIVTERTEPTLQLAESVDVIGSREITPVPATREEEGGRRERRWEKNEYSSGSDVQDEMTPEQVSAELESLSQASRKFLEESKGRLKEQQQRNLPGGSPYVTFGMEEYRSASMKGLGATIEEMEAHSTILDQPEKRAVKPVNLEAKEEVDAGSGGRIKEPLIMGNIMHHLDDLEAEILTALDDASVALDSVDSEDTDLGSSKDASSSTQLSEEGEEEGSRVVQLPKEAGWSSGVRMDRSKNGGVPKAGGMKEDKKAPPLPAVKPKPARDWREEVELRRKPENRDVPVRRDRAATNGLAKRMSYIQEEVMEDLDKYLESELASINDMFEQFETQDQQFEQRIRSETQELQAMETKTKEDHRLDTPKATTLEEVVQRKTKESRDIEHEWEEEMHRLEEERLKAMKEQEIVKELTVESDSAVQNLEQEWKSLLEQEEQLVEETQREKVLLKQREKEERERKERERKENQQEMTVEEWIGWMEVKRKEGMTPQQQAEYDRRKKLWLEKEKVKEEKRRREEEERKRKAKERLEAEQRSYYQREKDVKEHRLSASEMHQLLEEQQRKEGEERREREERGRRMKEEMKQRALDEMRPKAKSALAARWEQSIKARTKGSKTSKDYRSTVLSGPPPGSDQVLSDQSLQKEEEQMQRRISAGGKANGDAEAAEKRLSLQ